MKLRLSWVAFVECDEATGKQIQEGTVAFLKRTFNIRGDNIQCHYRSIPDQR